MSSIPPDYSNGPNNPGYPPPQGQPAGYPPHQGHPGYPGAHNYAGGPGGPPPNSSKTAMIIAGVVVLLALLGAGVFLLSNSDSDDSSYAASTPAATAPAAPAPAAPAPGAQTPPPGVAAAATPAAASTNRRYANSPGDGYLSLRSDASASSGSRVLQIPHGAAVDVSSCGAVETAGGTSGRWCQATYNGSSGYVFDAYLASSQPAPRTASSAPSGSGGSRPTPGATYEQESTYQVTGASAFSVRTHPSVNAPRAGTIPRDGLFNTERCEENSRREGGTSRTWCYVRAHDGGVEGWASVNNNFVTLIAG